MKHTSLITFIVICLHLNWKKNNQNLIYSLNEFSIPQESKRAIVIISFSSKGQTAKQWNNGNVPLRTLTSWRTISFNSESKYKINM